MKSIEFLNKRVAGKESEIVKLEKKIERINKAKESGWEVNPYYYNENDLYWANKDLDKAKADLESYREQLAEAIERAESRNVKVIIDFLEIWKTKTREFYIESVDEFITERTAYYKIDRELCEKWNRSKDRAERAEIRGTMRFYEEQFKKQWNWIAPYVERNELNLEKLDKDIKEEAERKYDFIIERTVAITGTITDASNLYIGDDGCELNGYIIGEKGKAKVQTIGAGGWNIQRFHFRTLIHKMK